MSGGLLQRRLIVCVSVLVCTSMCATLEDFEFPNTIDMLDAAVLMKNFSIVSVNDPGHLMADVKSLTRGLYELKKIKLGVEVVGVNLSETISKEVAAQIERDVLKHKLLVFKNQGVLDPTRQIEITKLFGEVVNEGLYHHEKAPNPLVRRLSNDPVEGITGAGNDGLHTDGSYLLHPHSHVAYHIINTSRDGRTAFIDIHAVLHRLPAAQLARWDRLSIVRKTPNHGIVIHPLIYQHPQTHEQTMVFHLSTEALSYVWDVDTPDERYTTRKETVEITEEIDTAFRKNNEQLFYYHKWEAGDFLLTDNLALAHLAAPETQLPPEKVGLRVMHRTTARGTNRPAKAFRAPSIQRQDIIKKEGCLAGATLFYLSEWLNGP